MIASALLTTTVAAKVLPEDDLGHLSVPFKIAIVDGAIGSKDIHAGNYVDSIDKIKQLAITTDERSVAKTMFEKSMNLCVANIKLEQFAEAKLACSEAIEVIDGKIKKSSHSRYLTAIAYSNRAIVNHYLGDKAAAFADLNVALKIDDNSVIKANIEALNLATMKKELLAKNY